MELTKSQLGNKIRKFRRRKGISQLDLELDINTSPGRISRIETGKINPDKETIISIAKSLELKSAEIASLFGIELVDLTHLSDALSKLILYETEEDIIDYTVNELSFKLGYIATAIFIKEKNKLFMRGLTKSQYSDKALALLSKPLDEHYISYDNAPENLTVKAVKDSKQYITDYTRDFICPMVSKEKADMIQEVAEDKSNIIFPLECDKDKIGAIIYVAKYYTDFTEDKDILKLISDQIAATLYKCRTVV